MAPQQTKELGVEVYCVLEADGDLNHRTVQWQDGETVAQLLDRLDLAWRKEDLIVSVWGERLDGKKRVSPTDCPTAPGDRIEVMPKVAQTSKAARRKRANKSGPTAKS